MAFISYDENTDLTVAGIVALWAKHDEVSINSSAELPSRY